MAIDRIVAVPCVHSERIGQVVALIPRVFSTSEGEGFRSSQTILHVDGVFAAVEGDRAVADKDHRSPRLEAFLMTPEARATISQAGQDVLFVDGVAVATYQCRVQICCEVQPARIGKSLFRSNSRCSLVINEQPSVRAKS